MNAPSDRALVTKLSERIDAVLGALLAPGQRVALINFPNHANAGDSALWIGELAALRRAGARVMYQASWASYRRDELARVLREGDVILLHGGGNFGDLYLHNQAVTRLNILRDFPHVRTLQLPQSIWFQEERNREELRRACEEHRDFTLLVRDQQSLDLARAHFQVPTQLCPDMAFALGPLARAQKPQRDILWLARTDVESSGYRPPASDPNLQTVDWLTDLADEEAWNWRGRLAKSINQRLHETARHGRPATWGRHRLLTATFAPLARAWVQRGCLILARGRVVVTDRLHGHLLALMQDIPHVVLDNSYGKLRTMYETWTHPSMTAHWAENAEQALKLARELAAHTDS